MIQFLQKGKVVLLSYIPEFPQEESWIDKEMNERGWLRLKKTFNLKKSHVISSEIVNPLDEDDFEGYKTAYFQFATLKGDYYKVIKGILVSEFDIYIHKNVSFKLDYFVADSNVSIFKLIETISTEDIYIDGDAASSIPISDFESLVKKFPTSYEKKKYAEARVSSVLRNYLEKVKDSEKVFEAYLNKKIATKKSNLLKTFQETDLIKYQTINEKLLKMLDDENEYTEHQWQNEILQIVLLLYPKYIFVFKEVSVITKLEEGIKKKYIDFLLVDSNGNVDIVEIKKPFGNAIMTKTYYRDNYIPLRELSGAVMQIEKYIYYLNRWSSDGEKYLTEKYREELPQGFSINITNPSGIIIMGRDNNLSVEQKRDFEVVKRKYKNVVDIITYDNMLERLKFTIDQIKKL